MDIPNYKDASIVNYFTEKESYYIRCNRNINLPSTVKFS